MFKEFHQQDHCRTVSNWFFCGRLEHWGWSTRIIATILATSLLWWPSWIDLALQLICCFIQLMIISWHLSLKSERYFPDRPEKGLFWQLSSDIKSYKMFFFYSVSLELFCNDSYNNNLSLLIYSSSVTSPGWLLHYVTSQLFSFVFWWQKMWFLGPPVI